MSKNSKFALGAVFGAIAGVIGGLLFAPQSGEETRKDIKDGANKAIDKMHKEAEKLQKDASGAIDKAETAIKDAGRTATKRSKELLAEAKTKKDTLGKVVSSVKDGKSDDKDLDKAIKEAKKAKDALVKYLKK